jgi:YD repeat-containing protein
MQAQVAISLFCQWFRTRHKSLAAVALLALLGADAGAATGSVAYTYDALGRVTTASYDTGACVIYAYDANGNRTSQTINVSASTTAVWGNFLWGCANWH